MQQIQRRRSKGKIIAIILFVLLLGLVGAGLYAWNEFLKINAANNVGEATIKQSSGGVVEAAKASCANGEDTSATSGMFCSEDMGIKLFVPKLFVGTMTESGNYQVYTGSLNPNAKVPAGTSQHVYTGTGASGGTFTLTIAKESKRTGYIGFYHALQDTYYDASTDQLTLVKSPTSQYDSSTQQTKTTGTYTKSEPVPAFTAGTVRFYEGRSGDAGNTTNSYLTVVGDSFIKISLKYVGDPSKASSKLTKPVMEEMEKSLRTLVVL